MPVIEGCSFRKKDAKQYQKAEASLRSPKDDNICEAIMDTAEPCTSAGTEKPMTFSSYRPKLFSAIGSSPITCSKNKALYMGTSIT